MESSYKLLNQLLDAPELWQSLVIEPGIKMDPKHPRIQQRDILKFSSTG